MKTEVKTYETQCDCCRNPLPTPRTAFLNDGSYQTDYVTIGSLDLCFICAGKIFDINLSSKIPEEKMTEWIKDARKRLKYDIGMLNLNVGENLYDTLTMETTGVNECLQTTGIEATPTITGLDAMTPVTNSTVSVKDINKSTVTNLGDL